MPEGVREEAQRELPAWTKDEDFRKLTELIVPPLDGQGAIVASGFDRQRLATSLADLGDGLATIIQSTAQSERSDDIGVFSAIGLDTIVRRPLNAKEKTLAALIATESLLKLNNAPQDGVRGALPRFQSQLLYGPYNVSYPAVLRGNFDQDRVRAIRRVVQAVTGLPDTDTPEGRRLKELTDTVQRNDRRTTERIVDAAKATLDIAQKPNRSPRAEYDPADPPRDIKSHEYRTARMRIPFLKEFFTVISHIRQFKDQTEKFLSRRKELQRNTRLKNDSYRILSPLFAAIYRSERFGWLLDKAIDRAAERESQRIELLASTRYNVVDTMVLGAGLHGSVFASELRHFMPDAEILLVDAGERLGGQFADGEREVFNANSRTRPQDPAERAIPGQKGNLNSLGEHAVLQVPDITTDTYTNNRVLARAIRTNDMLSAPTLLHATGQTVEKLSPQQAQQYGAKYRVGIRIQDGRGDRTITMYCNRLINAGGLGEEAFPGIDTDNPDVARIIAQAKQDLARKITPKVLHSSWYWKTTGDGANEFPRKDFTGSVMVIGDGDSAYTVLEDLLGYGPGGGNSVIQLDWPQNITWVGQEATDKKELLKKLRPRYVDISLDMPRSNYSYSRIDPNGGRAYDILQRNDGKIVVRWRKTNGEMEQRIVDRVIFATGYQDRTPETLSSELFSKRTVEREDLYDLKGQLRREYLVSGTILESLDGDQYRIISQTTRSFRVGFTQFGAREETVFPISKRELLAESFREATLPVPTLISATTRVGIVRTIARKVFGEEIYSIGPNAKIPLQSADNIDASFFEIIPENTAAAFLTVPRTEEFAKRVANDIRITRQEANGAPDIPADRSLIRNLRKIVSAQTLLPKSPFWRRLRPGKNLVDLGSDRLYSQPAPNGSFSDDGVPARLPSSLDLESWLQIAVGGTLENFRFPPEKRTYKFHFVREPQFVSGETFAKPFIIKTDAPIDPGDPDWRSFARALSSNRDFLAVFEKRTKQPARRQVNPDSININAGETYVDRRTSEAILSIPVDNNGQPDITKIELHTA